MTLFLTLKEILEIHEEQLDAYGGLAGIRDLAALESAAAMPQAMFDSQLLHPTLAEQAAAYAFHLAESQAFVDGNKRTGAGSATTFVLLNGFVLDHPEDALADAIVALATHDLDKRGLSALFLEWLVVDCNED